MIACSPETPATSHIIDGNSAAEYEREKRRPRQALFDADGKSAKRIEDGQRRWRHQAPLARLHHSDGMLHKNWRIAARARRTQ